MSQITVTSAFALLVDAGFTTGEAATALHAQGFDATAILHAAMALPTVPAPAPVAAPAKAATKAKATKVTAPVLKACKRAGCSESVVSKHHQLCAQHSKESADRSATFLGARAAVREAQAAAGVDNRTLAAALRQVGIKPTGAAWTAAKAAIPQGLEAAIEAARGAAV
jgi:hypothetical protein